MSQSASANGAPPVKKRDRTHYLYVAVIVAVLAGIVVGLAAPEHVEGAQAAEPCTQ